MILPLLLLLVLGIVELGFLLGERSELKHGAHEGARLAAVDDANLLTNTCDTMLLNTTPSVDFEDGASGELGDTGMVTVSTNIQSLSGINFIEVFLPSTMSVSLEFRLEQDSDNWDSNNQDGSC